VRVGRREGRKVGNRGRRRVNRSIKQERWDI